MKKYFFLLWVLVFSSTLQAQWHQREAPIMGTRVFVELWHEDPIKAQGLIDSVMGEMERINQLMSPYIETSDVAKVNAQGHLAAVAVSNEMIDLVERANYYSELTHGAFDITFASLGYQFDYRSRKKPTEQQRSQAAQLINYRALVIDKTNRTLAFKKAGMKIDLGGIAKGHVVDTSIELLLKAGVKHAIVTAGGDSRIIGDRRGRPWMLGVRHPRGDDHVISLPLESIAISTSGDYERYFVEDGVRYHHIIDPSKGQSAREVISTTILADRSTDADALSTSVFILGVQQGLELINGLSGISAIIIDKRGKVHYSNDLADPAMQKP